MLLLDKKYNIHVLLAMSNSLQTILHHVIWETSFVQVFKNKDAVSKYYFIIFIFS